MILSLVLARLVVVLVLNDCQPVRWSLCTVIDVSWDHALKKTQGVTLRSLTQTHLTPFYAILGRHELLMVVDH